MSLVMMTMNIPLAFHLTCIPRCEPARLSVHCIQGSVYKPILQFCIFVHAKYIGSDLFSMWSSHAPNVSVMGCSKKKTHCEMSSEREVAELTTQFCIKASFNQSLLVHCRGVQGQSTCWAVSSYIRLVTRRWMMSACSFLDTWQNIFMVFCLVWHWKIKKIDLLLMILWVAPAKKSIWKITGNQDVTCSWLKRVSCLFRQQTSLNFICCKQQCTVTDGFIREGFFCIDIIDNVKKNQKMHILVLEAFTLLV